MNYTPGPWQLSQLYKRTAPDCDVTDLNRVISKGRFIADVATNDDEQEANARLIAAAPDLLEALVDLMEQVDVLIENTPELDPIPFKLTIVVAARAAIAKATGKS